MKEKAQEIKLKSELKGRQLKRERAQEGELKKELKRKVVFGRHSFSFGG